MLNPVSYPPVKGVSSQLIAGQFAGIPVRCTPAALPVYNNLVQMAKSGNHWARLVVSGIQGLSSGRLHLDNVFVKQNTSIVYGNEEFFVVLPGCTATVEKGQNGEFKLLTITADARYFEKQALGKKPGLYRVGKVQKSMSVNFVADGKIENTKDRVVAITDQYNKSPKDVVEEIKPFISKAPVSGGEFTINNNGFEMHYSPGNRTLGGLINAQQAMMAESDPKLHESAILLANTMYNAKDIDGVRWISERGGSGVLTQAMKILSDKKITLEKHTVFFSNPTTNKSKAINLARKIGLQFDRTISTSNPMRPGELFGGMGFLGEYVVAYQRWKNDDDYGVMNLTGDVVRASSNLKTVGITVASVGAALGIASTAVSAPALITFAGAVSGAISLGDKLAEAYVPRLYYKITGKF